MSRRRDRAARHAEGGAGARRAEAGAPEPDRSRSAEAGAARARTAPAGPTARLAPQLAILTAVFAVTVGLAELAGAANLGVSLGIGQVAFALVLVVLFSRR